MNYLKKGAYDVFQDDDDSEEKQFMETDIDQLIERNSQTVTYGSCGKSTMSSGMGGFSRAIFAASTEDGDGQNVDLDDHDFWEKAVGIEDSQESIGEGGIKVIFEKRSRKQVKVYDPYDEFAEVCPYPATLLLSSGTYLNTNIR